MHLQGLSPDELHELGEANSKVLLDLLEELGLQVNEGETMLKVLLEHRSFLAPPGVEVGLAEPAAGTRPRGTSDAVPDASVAPSDLEMKNRLRTLQVPMLVAHSDHHGNPNLLELPGGKGTHVVSKVIIHFWEYAELWEDRCVLCVFLVSCADCSAVLRAFL